MAEPRRGDVPAVGALRYNERVRAALQRWEQERSTETFAGVLRELVDGELLLDASGQGPSEPGHVTDPDRPLTVGTWSDEAGRRLVLAFSGPDTLEEFHPGEAIRPLPHPAPEFLAHALGAYDGIALDPGSPHRLIAYAEEIRMNLTAHPAASRPLRSALVAGTASLPEMIELLRDAPQVFVAVDAQHDSTGEVTGLRMPTAVTADGRELHPVFTSPAEVFTWAPHHSARPTTAARVAAIAAERGDDGLLVNPAGPSLEIAPGGMSMLIGETPRSGDPA